MKPFILPIISVMLIEAGSALVLLNASPHTPLGFRLWFGSLAVISPFAGCWLYRRIAAPKA